MPPCPIVHFSSPPLKTPLFDGISESGSEIFYSEGIANEKPK